MYAHWVLFDKEKHHEILEEMTFPHYLKNVASCFLIDTGKLPIEILHFTLLKVDLVLLKWIQCAYYTLIKFTSYKCIR